MQQEVLIGMGRDPTTGETIHEEYRIEELRDGWCRDTGYRRIWWMQRGVRVEKFYRESNMEAR